MSHECCSVSEVEVILVEVEILLYFLFVAVEGTVVERIMNRISRETLLTVTANC